MTRRHALEPRGRPETLAGGERQVRPQLDLSTARRRGEGTCLPRQRPLPAAVRNLPDTTVSEIAVKEAMMNAVVAIPSANPGGLDAEVGAHFGHCDLYTLVEINDGQIAGGRVIPNVPHEQGGCMAPVQHLAQHGVTILIAGGMGMRPLMGFNQVGIDVYHTGNLQTAGEAVTALVAGDLSRFGQEHTCGGGGSPMQRF